MDCKKVLSTKPSDVEIGEIVWMSRHGWTVIAKDPGDVNSISPTYIASSCISNEWVLVEDLGTRLRIRITHEEVCA